MLGSAVDDLVLGHQSRQVGRAEHNSRLASQVFAQPVECPTRERVTEFTRAYSNRPLEKLDIPRVGFARTPLAWAVGQSADPFAVEAKDDLADDLAADGPPRADLRGEFPLAGKADHLRSANHTRIPTTADQPNQFLSLGRSERTDQQWLGHGCFHSSRATSIQALYRLFGNTATDLRKTA